VTYKPKRRRPVREYLALQRRFEGLRLRDIQGFQREVDAAWRGIR
jgi:pyruvate/2-oxoacid:ferredoxin oxidoreductase beta subunit